MKRMSWIYNMGITGPTVDTTHILYADATNSNSNSKARNGNGENSGMSQTNEVESLVLI